MASGLMRRIRELLRLLRAGQFREAFTRLREAVADRNRDQEAVRRDAPAPAETGRGATSEAAPSEVADPAAVASAAADAFVTATLRGAVPAHVYKCFSPVSAAGRPAPLVVMLHGCQQDPDDFAAGTAMNERAHAEGFHVLYPGQSPVANRWSCWNWFKSHHQSGDRGEPAWIMAVVDAVIARHAIDPERIYLAGLSAGGAMAAILAEAWPDRFAAVGIHSGLPVGAARSGFQALGVMKTGKVIRWGTLQGPAVPVMVFHGDSDVTVHPAHGDRIVADAVERGGAGTQRTAQGQTGGSRIYTRIIHDGADGRVLAEHWRIHGLGHAWSGGRPAGSFTDAAGPDATGEMLRFFREHGRRGGVARSVRGSGQ